jgi:hypothetical protein
MTSSEIIKKTESDEINNPAAERTGYLRWIGNRSDAAPFGGKNNVFGGVSPCHNCRYDNLVFAPPNGGAV